MSIQTFLESRIWRVSECPLRTEHRCFNISTVKFMSVLFERTHHPFSTSCYQNAGYVIFQGDFLNNLMGKVLQKNRTNRLYIEICNRKFNLGIGFCGYEP